MPGWFDLGKPYETTWAGRPPQMLPEDVPTWQEWRETQVGEWDSFYYNVALTLRPIDVSKMTPNMMKTAMHSYAKRIDAVAVKKGLIWIIEVTSRAAVRSIGQALTYRFLWGKLRPLPDKYEAVILCQWADKDIQLVCEAHKIRLIQLNPIE